MKLNKINISILGGLAVLITSLALAKANKRTDSKDVVTLEAKNTLTFNLVFTPESVRNVQVKAMKLSEDLKASDTIYLYLNTPGGEVTPGMELIETLKGLPQKVVTVTNFAASMGFITSQSLGERYVTSRGVYMSHRMRGGVQGFIPGELNSRANFYLQQANQINNDMAKRLGLTSEAYYNRIVNEYWVSGQDAVKDGVADRVVNLRCGTSLSGTYKEEVSTQFGAVNVEWSKCPLVSAPISVDFAGLNFVDMSEERKTEIKNYLYKIIVDKEAFLQDTKAREVYNSIVK